MSKVAFGGVVWREGPGSPELLLVHRPRYSDWGFPKGGPRPGEPAEDTALREVWEETGLRCRLGRPVGHKSYQLPGGDTKTSYYWSMTPVSGRFAPGEEVDRVRWVSIDRAAELLSYSSDVALLEGMPSGWMEAVPRLFIVRHAEAGVRNDADPDDIRRELTERGWKQAQGLVDVLATERIERLLSSPATRCLQTLEPLSVARGIPVEVVDDLMENHPERGLPYLAQRDTVLSTHGDVIPVMLDSLLEDGCELGAPRLWKKGSTWAIDFAGELPVRARYLPPPA